VDQIEGWHAGLIVDDALAIEQNGLHLELADGSSMRGKRGVKSAPRRE
jgi:hypothetical protein